MRLPEVLQRVHMVTQSRSPVAEIRQDDRDVPAVVVGQPVEVFRDDVFRRRYGELTPGGARHGT